MSDREKFDLIERYLTGDLTASEQDYFQKLWATDPEFAEEVNYHELVNDFIIDAGLLDFKEKVAEYTNTKPQPKPNFFKKVVGKTRNLVIASIILILTGFGIGLWSVQQPFNGTVDNQAVTEAKKSDSSIPEAHPESKIKGGTTSDKPNSKKDRPVKSNDSKGKSNTPDQKGNTLLDGPNNESDYLSYNKAEKPTLKKSERLNYSSNLGSLSNSSILKKTRPKSDLSITLEPSIEEKIAQSACEATEIKGKVKTVPSCQDKNNGKLKVKTETIVGGQPPYNYRLSTNTGFSNKTVLSQLGEGKYTVEVRDNKGCLDTLASHIKVRTEQCGKRSFTFVPEQETRWKFPFKDEPSGNIKIFHEGQEVYTDRINQGIPVGWSGKLNNGKNASMGLYRVVFNPNGGQPKIWLLTVIR